MYELFKRLFNLNNNNNNNLNNNLNNIYNKDGTINRSRTGGKNLSNLNNMYNNKDIYDKNGKLIKSFNNNNKDIYDKNGKLIKSFNNNNNSLGKDGSKSDINNNSMNNNTNNLLDNYNNYLLNTSSSYITNYTNRYNRLKEYVKPIIGTNQIAIFDPQAQKINKITVNLTKEENGYNLFPDGCRHIFVDDILYITGGVDALNNPINYCNTFNIKNFELKKMESLNYPHSYHALEYLENYDCIVLIGGELNTVCEIFDIYSKKWVKLPDLNIPRANTNIYYDNTTSDLYVLFGMNSTVIEKNKNTDVIEVLELNDIKSGWMKVDYYQSAGLDLKLYYCVVLPFNRDQLLIYGGSKGRERKKAFALFNMNKCEINKVDKETLELIKIEEKKTKLVDMVLSKIN